MQNRLYETKKVVYGLKRTYGLPITIRKPGLTTQDVETGRQTIIYSTASIQRAILLPMKQVNDSVEALLAVIAKSGGYINKSTRTLIIDSADLPSTYILDNTCEITFSNDRTTRYYKIVSVELVESTMAWICEIEDLTIVASTSPAVQRIVQVFSTLVAAPGASILRESVSAVYRGPDPSMNFNGIFTSYALASSGFAMGVDDNSVVTLTAQPIVGYTFDHWVLDGVAQTVGTNPLVFTVSKLHVVKAHYTVNP